MTNTANDIKKQLQTMVDATDNKEQIETLGALNSLVDKMVDEYNHLQDEQKSLLTDYKELIKHTSFKPNGSEQTQVDETKNLTFGDFLDAYKSKKD